MLVAVSFGTNVETSHKGLQQSNRVKCLSSETWPPYNFVEIHQPYGEKILRLYVLILTTIITWNLKNIYSNTVFHCVPSSVH